MLGHPVEAAVFATQSIPEILQVNVKPHAWVDTDGTHTSDHQPEPSSPRTLTATRLAALLTPLEVG